MAIAIDLLPGYVGLNKLFKRLIMVAVLLVVVTGGVLYSLYYKNQQLLHKYDEEAAAIEKYATQATNVQREADAAVSEVAPMQGAISFMADASKTGPERAALLNLISKYIYYRPGQGAVINLMDISDGTVLKLTATVDSTTDYNNFVYTLRSGSALRTPPGPLFSDMPVASGIPGYPSPKPNNAAGPGTTAPVGGAQAAAPPPGMPYQKILALPPVNAQGTLKNKVMLPPDPVGDTGGGGSGYPGGSSSSGYPGSGS